MHLHEAVHGWLFLAQGHLQLPIKSDEHGVPLLALFLPQKHFVTHFMGSGGSEWDEL